jgi:hypothetical protein
MILKWLAHGERYPVVMMQKYIESYFGSRGCQLIREFDNKYVHGLSHYVAFRKLGPDGMGRGLPLRDGGQGEESAREGRRGG